MGVNVEGIEGSFDEMEDVAWVFEEDEEEVVGFEGVEEVDFRGGMTAMVEELGQLAVVLFNV